MRKISSVLLVLFISLYTFAQNGKDPVKVTDMLKIRSINGVTLTKDAAKAAFPVTAIEPDGDSKLEYK